MKKDKELIQHDICFAGNNLKTMPIRQQAFVKIMHLLLIILNLILTDHNSYLK